MPSPFCAPLWVRFGRPSSADMWGRRIAYLTGLFGCLVFYGFYREWFSWVLLLTVAGLPWFSLALSLPAMVTVQATLRCPESVRVGVPVRTALQVECKFPTPPVSSRIRLHNSLTDGRFVGRPGERIPTEHCGLMTIAYDRLFVYDYLGLFCRRLRKGDSCTVYIEPKAVPSSKMPSLAAENINAWRPKQGGGHSENHDLRLYRPGDDLRQIHWKMTAKTGKLIYREPIEPVQKGYLLTMTLWGEPEQLDRKLGQLVWLSDRLLEQHLEHSVRCRTGSGTVTFSVTDAASRQEGIRALLRSRPAESEGAAIRANALWQHHIGGDGDEA